MFTINYNMQLNKCCFSHLNIDMGYIATDTKIHLNTRKKNMYVNKKKNVKAVCIIN